MITRQAVWSDETVQERLQSFIPAADEVWKLHHLEGPECDLFRKVSEQGHYAGRTVPSDTRQGIYAMSPSGVLLGSCNEKRARSIVRLLDQALEAWEALPESERYLPAEQVTDAPLRRRAESAWPKDGLVLRVTSRDLPRPPIARDAIPGDDRRDRRRGGRSRSMTAWNFDYAWFRADEIDTMIPREATAGATRRWPAHLARRLAALHFIDNVRGQVGAFDLPQVESAMIQSRITRIDGTLIQLALTGSSRAVAPEPAIPEGTERSWQPQFHERGVDIRLLGSATWDLTTQRFTAFELIGHGSRWGGMEHNSRGRDAGPAGIGFVLTAAPNDPPVAPAFFWKYGWK